MTDKKMTEEERLELATKLDKELDDFIDSLEKRRYTEGWPEDRWQEEMDKHPFFMKNLPKDGEPINPLMEGMQLLKYDPNENTKEELTINYKEDGTFYMKHKKYRMAILAYTEGININCGNNEIQATLFNNRSAANFFLKNYRSSLIDCENAIKLKPDYLKAKWRAAQCSNFLKKYDICIQFCDSIFKDNRGHKEALQLRKKCITEKTALENEAYFNSVAEKRKIEEINRTVNELNKRDIKFEGQKRNKGITKEFLKPSFEPLENFPIKSDKSNNLVWPMVFCYPEFLITDFQQQVDENIVLNDCLAEMFKEFMEIDKKKIYKPNNLNLYYENRVTANVYLVDLNKTIKELVQEKFFLVRDGCIILNIVPKNSTIEDSFKNEKRRPLVFKDY